MLRDTATQHALLTQSHHQTVRTTKSNSSPITRENCLKRPLFLDTKPPLPARRGATIRNVSDSPSFRL